MDQRLWQVLLQTNEWVRYSDGKAVALLGIQGVLIGLFLLFLRDLNQGAGLTPASTALLSAGIVCILASMVFTFLCLTPRLKSGGKASPIFFWYVAASFKTPKDYSQYLGENFSTEEQISEVLAEQIHANSRIASVKFRWVSWSTRLTLLGLTFWAVFLFLNVF